MAKTVKVVVGRSAIDGRFTTVEKAQRAAKTHVVETIKRPSAPPSKSGKK